jgi:hypothetical protein
LGALVIKKNFAVAKELFAFVAYKRHSQYIKRKLGEIQLALIVILPVLYNAKVLVLGKKYTVGNKIFFKAINWRRAVTFRVSRLKALVSLGGGIDLLSRNWQ